MCERNYAELLEVDALLSLSFFLSIFALSGVYFSKRVKQDSTATLREAVNHSKPEATNTTDYCIVKLASAAKLIQYALQRREVICHMTHRGH